MPHALIILDGWGIAPPHPGNAIAQAHTPTMDYLQASFSTTTLLASGSAVGLPAGRDGNSEAGHMNIGAGRIVEQDAVMINNQIKSGAFFKNPALLEAVRYAKKQKSHLHLMGMLTNRMSAHAYQDHLEALLLFCQEQRIQPYLHLFTDGRDAPPHEAIKLLKCLQDRYHIGQWIATLMGRFYAMDRNKRWGNTAQAYHAMVCGIGEPAESAESAITRAYNRNETDEFIRPQIINTQGLIHSHDAIIFFNLRSDRARQLTKAFVQPDFNQRNHQAFRRRCVLKRLRFVTMADFGPDLDDVMSAFPAADLVDTLPRALAPLRQLYIAESEKYAHVTYFFNGGFDHPVDGEQWCKIPSPSNPDYIVNPAMGAPAITDYVLEQMAQQHFDFYVINFANADMLGHTGNLKATIKGSETIDAQLNRIWQAIKTSNGLLFITADHGNAEELLNVHTGETDTEHSTARVPFIITKHRLKLKQSGRLANVAPTILKLLNLPKPKAMTARALC